MIPREHGAWSMLLVPLAGALVLARGWNWSLVPAATAMLVVFLMREPLVVLARQRWVWRDPRPETVVARSWLAAECAVLGVAGAALLALWPWRLACLFGGAALLLTLTAVWMTVQNRQRSAGLQVTSAAGLAASALAVSVSVSGEIRDWAIWLWLLCTAHSVASIFVVHARLEARIAARVPDRSAVFRRPAWVAQLCLLAGAGTCAALGRPLPAAALALSAMAHIRDLRNLEEAVPLRTVGLRAMALSIGFAALVVSGLWRHS